LVPYYFKVDGLALYISFISLSTSTITAVYSILAKPDPNKKEKQAIYGQLRKTLKEDISRLEKKEYENITLGPWDNIQQDERHHLVDGKLRERLDALFKTMNQYNSAITKLNNKILLEIIKDTAEEVFKKEINYASSAHILTIILHTKKKPPREIDADLVYSLKRRFSMEELINYQIKSIDWKKEDVLRIDVRVSYPKADKTGPHTSQDSRLIIGFYEQCVKKTIDVSEYKLMIKENETMLKEAREILQQVDKRIRKTIEL
jgi:hypothetical protein